MKWQVISIWRMEEADSGKYEQQMTDMVGDDGAAAMHTEPVKLQLKPPSKMRSENRFDFLAQSRSRMARCP